MITPRPKDDDSQPSDADIAIAKALGFIRPSPISPAPWEEEEGGKKQG